MHKVTVLNANGFIKLLLNSEWNVFAAWDPVFLWVCSSCALLIPVCVALNPLCHTNCKGPWVEALQGGLAYQPLAERTVDSGISRIIKSAASSVPLAHWRMDKALDFTLLKEGKRARGAMKSMDPSLNGFVRGFCLANHGWKSPLNGGPAPSRPADSSEPRRKR